MNLIKSERQQLIGERRRLVRWFRKRDYMLTAAQFRLIDGGWTLDGMNPFEWYKAMEMD